MNINASGSGVAGLTKELMRAWEESKTHWRDAKAAEFEQRYLLPLLDSVDTLVIVSDKLDKSIRQVRTDCE